MLLEQLQQDVEYLAKRAQRAGSFSCGERRRDWGASSNYIISVAYGVGARQELPFDRSDYAACVRAVRHLPRHRRTPIVIAALRAAKAAWREQEEHRRRRNSTSTPHDVSEGQNNG